MICAYHPGVETTGACVSCGRPICNECISEAGGKAYCRSCAMAPAAGMPGMVKRGPSGMSIAALVLSLTGIFTCGITALIGMIFGIIEMSNINKGTSPTEGKGLAIAGFVVGAVFTVLWLLYWVLVIIVGVGESTYYW